MLFQKITLAPTWVAVLVLALALAGPVLSDSDHDRDGGSRIAFIQGPDVFSMKPDGTDVRQLTNLGPNNSAFWEAWSPDARQLVFTEFPPNVPSQLWMMNADGSKQHLLLKEAAYAEYAPSFSPDSSWIAFTRCQTTSAGLCAIYQVRTDGTGLRAVTDFQPDVFDFAPTYSPDGWTIAFESFNREGVLGAIYLMEADGSNIRRVTPTELGAVNASWSSDGQRIAFYTRCCNPQNPDIWTIDRDHDDLTRLTGSAASDRDIPEVYQNLDPSWSPRGRSIVFQQYLFASNSNAIFVMNADGSERNQILALPPSPRNGDASQRRKRHHTPHEIESGGAYPRWSPPQW